MKILFVDTETTGLKPEHDQIIEIGLLYWNTATGKTKEASTLVKHPTGYQASDAYALGMNGQIFKEIAAGTNVTDYFELSGWFADFMMGLPEIRDDEKITLSGKNVGSFDLQFLKRLPGWPVNKFRHRILDIGSLFFDPNEDQLPDLNKCAEKIGFGKQTNHRALDDCRMCYEIVKEWCRIKKGPQ